MEITENYASHFIVNILSLNNPFNNLLTEPLKTLNDGQRSRNSCLK